MQGVAHRIAASLSAGAIAIFLNVVALWSADLIHLPTAHGGILKLLVQLTCFEVPHGNAFNDAFHVIVGLAMALVYGLLLAPLWHRSPWVLGLIYAAVVWLANSFLVLPLIGEGFAGSATLSTAGIVWFAVAHTIFFVALALLYPIMSSRLPQLHARSNSN